MTAIGINLKDRTPFKSGPEKDYANYLELLKKGGEILEWWYEPIRLLIGWKRLKSGEMRGVYYTPDFMVQLPTYEIEFHETKGFKREAAMVRLSAAASSHPFRFRLVFGNGGKNGMDWKITEV